MPTKEKIGWIECNVHGKQKTWFVCVHISAAEDIKEKEEWTEEGGGSLICGIPGEKHSVEELRMLCEAHCRQIGLLAAA